MLEVHGAYLRANGFRTYIVTGGGQEFVRAYAERVYGVPAEQVIGSSIATKYDYTGRRAGADARAQAVLHRRQGRQGRSDINLFIGKRPHAAFGNSGGDREMLEWTGAGDGARLRCWCCTTTPSASTPTARRRPAGHQGRHVLPGARGRGEADGLDRDQHEERLEDGCSRRGTMSDAGATPARRSSRAWPPS